MRRGAVATTIVATMFTPWLLAGEQAPAERGKAALLGRAFLAPAWSSQSYLRASKRWNEGEASHERSYDDAFRHRYGLHRAPYENGRYPMGLRESTSLLGRGLTTDCLICHGGSIFGQSYVGLGNSSLDIQGLFEDLAAADGRPPTLPFVFSRVRGTSEAGAMAVYLLALREPDLRMRTSRLDLGLQDDLCEDPPAWWLLKKKQTMYHTGSGDAKAIRPLMLFLLSPLTLPSTFPREEKSFSDIRAYFQSLEAPKYPLPIDVKLAQQGKLQFEQACSHCHGTYGERPSYPNRVVPLEEIGTDPRRLKGVSMAFEEYYGRSWFGRERPGWFANDAHPRASRGYQAPPLDGVWATAPYLHNGSIPTVYHLLNSKSRPTVFTRSFRTNEEDYDSSKLGWKVRVLESLPQAGSAFEGRKVYDTRLPGRSNAGHLFGDDLTEEKRMAIIEYLKTL